ncbi:conserved hypothetical protein [Planktothrix serta PCC 8927]|uniref:Uncharacterized protein n=1 Tax=Planktothrix serta PCC 8927 TaxID=671068 RepID=A0A7Z9E2M0_9CYAN|nr:hypothetical protein [Planktothrix serta]VXD12207.1 conserved hypothetical protein [Planktothrix serta PCC 8927]VXD22477.1 conserved hypothetical protein [Planktothrix serta PCC 8927]VXD25546.1 conserved hypothetical protein [Planktothrix serta PCC 8927]
MKKITETKTNLPTRNILSFLSSIDGVLENWGYKRIGIPWEQVEYNPRFHQPDVKDIQPGETVYVRFVGYRDGDRICCPAKVSRKLPNPLK